MANFSTNFPNCLSTSQEVVFWDKNNFFGFSVEKVIVSVNLDLDRETLNFLAKNLRQEGQIAFNEYRRRFGKDFGFFFQKLFSDSKQNDLELLMKIFGPICQTRVLRVRWHFSRKHIILKEKLFVWLFPKVKETFSKF